MKLSLKHHISPRHRVLLKARALFWKHAWQRWNEYRAKHEGPEWRAYNESLEAKTKEQEASRRLQTLLQQYCGLKVKRLPGTRKQRELPHKPSKQQLALAAASSSRKLLLNGTGRLDTDFPAPRKPKPKKFKHGRMLTRQERRTLDKVKHRRVFKHGGTLTLDGVR